MYKENTNPFLENARTPRFQSKKHFWMRLDPERRSLATLRHFDISKHVFVQSKKIQRETQLTRKEKGREEDTPLVCEARRRGRPRCEAKGAGDDCGYRWMKGGGGRREVEVER